MMYAPVARPTRPTVPRPIPNHSAREGLGSDSLVEVPLTVATTVSLGDEGVSEGTISVILGVGLSGGGMGIVLPPLPSAAAAPFNQSPSSDDPIIRTADTPMRSKARLLLRTHFSILTVVVFWCERFNLCLAPPQSP